MQILIVILGIVVLLLVAWLCSENRKAIRFRTVGGAFAIQALFAAFILYVPLGEKILLAISNSLSGMLNYSSEGINFLFGNLGQFKMGFVFAVHVLPIIIFMSALFSVLYYLGIMQWIIRLIGTGIHKLLRTSPAESMAATANIFAGNTDVFVLMKPYAPRMTRSELFALMTGGVASIAGSVLVGYASMGIEIRYLVAASFMSAPGGLLMAKMLFPETEPENTANVSDDMLGQDEKPINIVEAATNGATIGLKLAANVGAMLLALIALIAMVNGLLGWFCSFFGYGNVTLQFIFSYLFAPVAWLLGIPTNEVLQIGSLLGQKLVLNEFVAYTSFIPMKDQLSEYSQIITIMALAGFANLSSPAALIGVLGGIVPGKKRFIAKMGLKVILAGTLSNLLSAALTGLFFLLAH
ncbi:NupC/NupG family nucleoside CNT transporter [Citrobacter freundii]|jgi:CNT family concentrative nucleoside transporter|uniref:NupC/NupG family nucleoside CNT transporter n=1 Tax=Citrobacter braakii TaxID=57706 RepID=UPI001E3699F4|nr:NupC/NupG family nucleoside CNT transporter [Citrobacter braakii]MCD9263180.1 NupC/NupG family nucleoside CNT transporter [Citrobacter braakii]MCW1433875.1 NupC/NupG family nucleoside CNT transporter [Citrobacter freundii]MCW1445399.1 NupC/NupG family nucleoside CNT transporter [Citrobacter freundii]MDX7345646.1 NupC/NupG family nucleoside CNT transporter [Citrobacter braakii]